MVYQFPEVQQTARDHAFERKVARMAHDANRTLQLIEAARADERERVQPTFWWAGCRFGLAVGLVAGTVLVAGALWAGRKYGLAQLAALIAA